MRKFILSAVISIVAVSSSPLLAQDFEGPSVGVQGGWEQIDLQNADTPFGSAPLYPEAQSVTGGLFLGYDRHVTPRITLGGEAGLDLFNSDPMAATTPTGIVSVNPHWSIDVTGRAGYVLNGETLAYVRGGVTSARVETRLATGSAQLAETESRNGWVVGAGIERHLLQNISGRLEYRYSDVGEGEGSFDRHRLLAGVAYRF